MHGLHGADDGGLSTLKLITEVSTDKTSKEGASLLESLNLDVVACLDSISTVAILRVQGVLEQNGKHDLWLAIEKLDAIHIGSLATLKLRKHLQKSGTLFDEFAHVLIELVHLALPHTGIDLLTDYLIDGLALSSLLLLFVSGSG